MRPWLGPWNAGIRPMPPNSSPSGYSPCSKPSTAFTGGVPPSPAPASPTPVIRLLQFKMVHLTSDQASTLLESARPDTTIYLVGAGGCGMSGLGHLLLD